MTDVKEIYRQYQEEAKKLKESGPEDLNAALTELENRTAENSGLSEGDRLELRAYMVEYRRQTVDGYEAGADKPHLSEPESGPRSGEYGPAGT
jgi:hypothetical protein